MHYYKAQDIKNDCEINDNFKKLYKRFCPGPLTFVLKLKNKAKFQNMSPMGKKH